MQLAGRLEHHNEQMPTVIFDNGTVPVRGITSTRFPGLQTADIVTADASNRDRRADDHDQRPDRLLSTRLRAS